MNKSNMIDLEEVYKKMADDPNYYRLLDKLVDSDSFLSTIKAEFKKHRYSVKQEMTEQFSVGNLDAITLGTLKIESYEQGRYTNYRLNNLDGTLFLDKLSRELIFKIIKDVNIAYAIKSNRNR